MLGTKCQFAFGRSKRFCVLEGVEEIVKIIKKKTPLLATSKNKYSGMRITLEQCDF
jgi:hypothetical protein